MGRLQDISHPTQHSRHNVCPTLWLISTRHTVKQSHTHTHTLATILTQSCQVQSVKPQGISGKSNKTTCFVPANTLRLKRVLSRICDKKDNRKMGTMINWNVSESLGTCSQRGKGLYERRKNTGKHGRKYWHDRWLSVIWAFIVEANKWIGNKNYNDNNLWLLTYSAVKRTILLCQQTVEGLSPAPLESRVYPHWTGNLATALNHVSSQLCLDPCGTTIWKECSLFFSLKLHIHNWITLQCVWRGTWLMWCLSTSRYPFDLWSRSQMILITLFKSNPSWSTGMASFNFTYTFWAK